MSTDNRPRVLLVDDSVGDVQLTRIAFEESGIQIALTAAATAKEALQLLSAQSRRPLFDMILLDLNLPDASGHDILAYCKRHDHLRDIPVAIVSTSDYPKDRQRAADLGAVEYIVKPNSFMRFVELLQGLERWLPSANGAQRS